MPRIEIPDDYANDPLWGLLGSHVPELAEAAGRFSNAAYQHTNLSHREFEAARMSTALINGCIACQWTRTSRDMVDRMAELGGDPKASVIANGEAPDETFYAAIPVWRESTLYSERERLAIEFAEKMGEAPQSFKEDEEFWCRIHEHFTDQEIVDLSLCVSSLIAMGRVVHVLELDTVCAPPPPPTVATDRVGAAN
jgi:alkylhydroperoxidase family enzyme